MPAHLTFPPLAFASSLLYFVFAQRLPFLSFQEIMVYSMTTGYQKYPVATAMVLSHQKEYVQTSSASSTCWDRPPPVWPNSLVIVQRRVPDPDSNVGPATTVTYYDYNLGGNLIIISPNSTTTNAETSDKYSINSNGNSNDNRDVLYDLELNSGHSYYYYPSKQTCKSVDFPVGILRPNWLQGATPLGPFKSWDGSGRVVCGWTKADFIDCFVDATTGIPDSWYFHTMKATFQVLNYTENPIIDPALFNPPEYCR